MISLIEGWYWQGSYWTKGSQWLNWSPHLESFTVATMTWLTIAEYLDLCHKWPRICPVFRNHNPVLSLFIKYHRVCNKSNTTGATCGAGIAYFSGAPEFSPVFSGFRVDRFVVFCVMFCRLLFVLLSFFFWLLCCPSFFDLRLLITTSIFFYIH